MLGLIFLITILGANFLTLKPTNEIASDIPPAPRKVYLGAWVGGSWDSKTKTLNIDEIKKFQKNIDRKIALVNIYSEWSYLSNPDLLTKLNNLSKEGWVPIISANPFFFEKCPDEGKNLYKTIASGACDEFLKEASQNLANYKNPLMFRFAWEMNLPQMYWGVQKVGSTPEDFVIAWRRFYEISKQSGAENIIWVLSFNTSHSGTVPYKDLYPGDDYVDWVAIDGYNWGAGHDFGGWASFDGTFKHSYKELTDITDKPVMLSEVNSSPDGGDKAAWLSDMLTVQLTERYDKVRAIVFFNENKTEGESVDWRLEKSKKYLEAVQEGLKEDIYKSSFP